MITKDDVDQKVLAAVVATCGHGLYLGYRYLRDGHVNPLSVAALVFMFVGTCLAAFMLRRPRVVGNASDVPARHDP